MRHVLVTLSFRAENQFYIDCKNEEHKYDILVALYSPLTIGSGIIFCHRRDTADRISARMTAEGHSVASLHGAKEGSERDRIVDEFREGKSKVLITTNVIARGIDIPQVNMVVNYDLPLTMSHQPDAETYLHRIGRTGRGASINFVHDKKSWEEMRVIEDALGKEIVRVPTDNFDIMEEVKTQEYDEEVK
ncbi:hypothetical protein BOTBODRAFT_371427 [Botryobasidium botryosum FD-172 SS1]|uniref:Helicase C-terminal domain-containing protein n=1 Tax=Botryobasidium botryosum (strain FD-172 SS1) TaxID=930990 RepID=A0A067MNW4_BOTB1|nr:hypothetical protein BOTBODRAFT_371427 [Botryobasidium botryosum FD-172 SS1]